MRSSSSFLRTLASKASSSKSLLSSSSFSRREMSKVCVLGASGGIGQPLSMLLKLSPAVQELGLYDVQGTPGVAADLSHVRSLHAFVCVFLISCVHLYILFSLSLTHTRFCLDSDASPCHRESSSGRKLATQTQRRLRSMFDGCRCGGHSCRCPSETWNDT